MESTINYQSLWIIMMNGDSNTIKTLCESNKIAKTICDNKEFWFEKFTNDNVPIDDSTSIIIENNNDKLISKYMLRNYIRWDNERKKWNAAHNKALDILTVFNIYYNQNRDVQIIKIDFGKKYMLNIFPETHQQTLSKLKFKETKSKIVRIFLDFPGYQGNNEGYYHFDYIILDRDSQHLKTIEGTITYDELINLLTKVFYYYPNIDITDYMDNTFIYENLLKEVKTKEVEQKIKIWESII